MFCEEDLNKLMNIHRKLYKLQVMILEISSIIIKGPKGSKSSINGSMYEKNIHSNIKYSLYKNEPLNSQHRNKLGGSSSGPDIKLDHNGISYFLEIKNNIYTDYGQASIDKINNEWKSKSGNKVFDNLLRELVIFDDKTPYFINNNITYYEFIKIKNASDYNFNDIKIKIPKDSIANFYDNKNCKYIQINGYGLYYLIDDPLRFNVPKFEPECVMRIRIKIHTRKNKKGYCKLSVTAAIRIDDKFIKNYPKSPYSLDDPKKFPNNITLQTDL